MSVDASRKWATPAARRDTRRAEILATAARLFSAKGYHATTMDHIAEQFGVTKPALYHYVGGKEQILAELFKDAFERLDAVRLHALAADDPRERIGRFVRGHVAVAAADTKVLFVLEIEADQLAADTFAHVRRSGREYRDALVESIELGRAQGAFSAELDARLSAYGILGMCSWLSTWYRLDGPRGVDEIAEHFATMALASLGA